MAAMTARAALMQHAKERFGFRALGQGLQGARQAVAPTGASDAETAPAQRQCSCMQCNPDQSL